MIASATPVGNAIDEAAYLLERARPPALRSMRQFAEDELVLPTGPYKGSRFRCNRQPYSGVFFDAVDSGDWQRVCALGPVQSGKTYSCFVVPTLYHLFEIGETVICGVPNAYVAADKWEQDLLPVIKASNFAHLLPSHGAGSKGGSKIDSITFQNGATLRFMTGGGGDEVRASFTARVVVISETDKLAVRGGQSEEADKIKQLEGRTRSYGARRRIYMECTVTTEDGRTWQEYTNGTESRLLRPCPHCAEWVEPGREHLVGWQDATDELAASDAAAFACPDCGATWSEDERKDANSRMVLAHRGQEVAQDGTVIGEVPRTRTLGFRWSAPDNHFVTAGDVAIDEYRATHSNDVDNAELELRQYVWTLPSELDVQSIVGLEASEIINRVRRTPQGVAPTGTTCIAVGTDVGQYMLHWVAIAFSEGATGTVIDYGTQGVPSREHGIELGILMALRQLRADFIEPGWSVDGEPRSADAWLVDSGWEPGPVYLAMGECDHDQYLPSKGFGLDGSGSYSAPQRKSKRVVRIGDGYHVTKQPKSKGRPATRLLQFDANQWKSWLHARLGTPMDQPGSLGLFSARPVEHLTLARHFVAEEKQSEYVPGKGMRDKWVRVSRSNHSLDAAALACIAAHVDGTRLLTQKTDTKSERPSEWFANQESR